jgi:hypothetical protein
MTNEERTDAYQSGWIKKDTLFPHHKKNKMHIRQGRNGVGIQKEKLNTYKDKVTVKNSILILYSFHN